jgi:hypothetical protein
VHQGYTNRDMNMKVQVSVGVHMEVRCKHAFEWQCMPNAFQYGKQNSFSLVLYGIITYKSRDGEPEIESPNWDQEFTGMLGTYSP